MNNNELDIIPVQKISMVDQVENNLRIYFKKQGFKVGDSLPTENELATSMGVSRNVIREALSRFKMLGLISSNKKKGLQIIKFNLFSALERVLDPDVLDETTLLELIELRIMLEIGMADALFKNITPQQIQELREIIDEYESSKKNSSKRVAYEIEFHSTLYAVTKNETVLGLQKCLNVVFDYVLKIEKMTDMTRIPEKKVKHLQLVECLENGTPEEFRHLMHDHFSTYKHLIFSKAK